MAETLFDAFVGITRAHAAKVALAPSVHVKACIVANGERLGMFDETFSRCVADVFEGGILTITSVDNDYVLKEYRPDQWREVTVYAASGYPDYSHINTDPSVACFVSAR